ncbi:hypothetical protein AAFN85_30060 [Mucilaginibacter sp. CAU 1740]|uniref:hypothetical protein n=1 Tax=Mucilaginibacter sp. CAU 1740 TaxID=3140365 RepID=UPI00325A7EF4
MEIEYLNQLNKYPSVTRARGYVKYLKPIAMDEIISLEKTYNGGNPFPKALRELLYIAGEYCYVLAYYKNNQAKMQEIAREDLADYELSISRPFYVVDVYNAHDQFLFVYLDEGKDDPTLYEAVFGGDAARGWIHTLNTTLAQFINSGLVDYLNGENPF